MGNQEETRRGAKGESGRVGVNEGELRSSGVNVGQLGISRGKQGYRKLMVWQNAYELRKLIYTTSKNFPISEFRRVSQMNDAARSTKQNIQEGYGRSLGEYIRYVVISKGSLAELAGDVEDCFDDGLINREQFEILNSIIGRTDFLLMRLVQSLRRKQNS